MNETGAGEEVRKKEIFRAVIESQDAGASVTRSRADAAKRFDVTVEAIKAIEREGIEAQWPPL